MVNCCVVSCKSDSKKETRIINGLGFHRAESCQRVAVLLEQTELLTAPEKLLFYLKLPASLPAPVSRSEIQQTVTCESRLTWKWTPSCHCPSRMSTTSTSDDQSVPMEIDEELDATASLARLTLSDRRLDYSYSSTIASAWPGPSHWRQFNNSKASSLQRERTQSTNSQSEPSSRRRRTRRTTRQLDFVNECPGFVPARDAAADYDVVQADDDEIKISWQTLSQWSEKNYKIPIDRGLEGSHFQKLFLKKSALLLTKRELKRQQLAAHKDSVHIADSDDYNYNSETDCSYCPDSQSQLICGRKMFELVRGNEEGAVARDVHELRPGNELEPPAKVAKMFIPYAMRAKKEDRKQLKITYMDMDYTD